MRREVVNRNSELGEEMKLRRGRVGLVRCDGATEKDRFIEVKKLPRIGSIIVVNEKEEVCGRYKAMRGCFHVQDLTNRGEYICRKLYSESIQHTTCLHQMDFIKGIFSFKEIAEPMYESQYCWMDLDLEYITETSFAV